MACEFYGNTPCIWDTDRNKIKRCVVSVYSDLLLSDHYKSDQEYRDKVHRACCKHSFQAMAYIRNEHLGRGICVRH